MGGGEGGSVGRRLVVIYDSEELATCHLPTRPKSGPRGPWLDVLIEYHPRTDVPRRGLHVAAGTWPQLPSFSRCGSSACS